MKKRQAKRLNENSVFSADLKKILEIFVGEEDDPQELEEIQEIKRFIEALNKLSDDELNKALKDDKALFPLLIRSIARIADDTTLRSVEGATTILEKTSEQLRSMGVIMLPIDFSIVSSNISAIWTTNLGKDGAFLNEVIQFAYTFAEQSQKGLRTIFNALPADLKGQFAEKETQKHAQRSDLLRKVLKDLTKGGGSGEGSGFGGPPPPTAH